MICFCHYHIIYIFSQNDNFRSSVRVRCIYYNILYITTTPHNRSCIVPSFPSRYDILKGYAVKNLVLISQSVQSVSLSLTRILTPLFFVSPALLLCVRISPLSYVHSTTPPLSVHVQLEFNSTMLNTLL